MDATSKPSQNNHMESIVQEQRAVMTELGIFLFGKQPATDGSVILPF